MLILMGVGSTASLSPGPPSFHAINSCLTFDPQKRVDEVLLEVKGQAEFYAWLKSGWRLAPGGQRSGMFFLRRRREA